ncbi:MAG: undecaprenyl-diphosphate phosphatase [Gammaproteobacteria bacterium]
MATNWHLVILAILQGITELFPVSSLGHAVLVPALLHWPMNRDAPWFLPFIVVLHLGTAAALLLFFWRDWWDILASLGRTRGRPTEPGARLFWLLVLGTVPAGLIGLALHQRIRLLFGTLTVAAVALAINGILLIAGDALKQRRPHYELERMGWGQSFLVGIAQALALIPGISRSGVTLIAGLGTGLDYAASARFSFLLATPIIGAAGLLEVPKLFHASLPHGLLVTIIGSGIVAGVCAWLSTWFLMRYFRLREVTALRPFGFYCLLAAGVALFIHFL